jgi:uncharacterized membrane protein
MKTKIYTNKTFLIIGAAVLLLVMAYLLWQKTAMENPYMPGSVKEAAGVILDGNAGE